MKIRNIAIPFFTLSIIANLAIGCFAAGQTYPASPSSDKAALNGSPVTIQAYKISGSNYVKLRDFAQLVTGTPMNFEVTWDGGLNAINLTTPQAYTPVGGEGTSIGSGETQAKDTTSAIYVNGQVVSLKGYNIHNNNYFKLRDLGSALGIAIDWDNETRTIIVDSVNPAPAGTNGAGTSEAETPEGTYELSPEMEADLQETLDWIGRDDPFAARVEAGWRSTLDPNDKRHPGWNDDGSFAVATLRPWQDAPKAEWYDMACAGGKSSWDGITVN